MSSTVIRVENLSKRYVLKHANGQRSGDGLRHALQETVTAPFRGLIAKFGSRKADPADSSLRSSPSAFSSQEDFYALKDVTFEVKRGEVLGIIGRNGAGKSTLLKILSRITEPSGGRIGVKGRIASLLEVGTGFHPELTGRENIYLNGAILGMGQGEVKRKFDEIVAFAEVEKFLNTPVKRYSSGMYVRLAFAVAAHLEPEILIVDEVLAVGDAAFQEKCLGKMGQVATSGRTVLFVSHNNNAIERLCSAILLLEKGQVGVFSKDVRAAFDVYSKRNPQQKQSPLWQSSNDEFRNDWFTPEVFSIALQDGRVISGNVRNDDEIYVQIQARVLRTDPALTIGYCLYDQNGTVLYWSYQTDSAKEIWPILTLGKSVLRSAIPRRFLNEGVYKIELIGGLSNREWLFEPGKNVPIIWLSIKGGLSDSPLWTGRRPGLLAPVLTWESQ